MIQGKILRLRIHPTNSGILSTSIRFFASAQYLGHSSDDSSKRFAYLFTRIGEIRSRILGFYQLP